MIIFKDVEYDELDTAWIDAQEMDCFVYMIASFKEDNFGEVEMDEILYIGKTTDLKTRLSGHEKRKDGCKSIYIKFHTKEEASYAEKVLINKVLPPENKEMYSGFQNDHYAEILNSKLWREYRTYKTDGKKLKNDKVEIE